MRARNLKPSIFKNELLATSDPLYTIVFEGLWCLADREGRLEDRPRKIHLDVNPGRAFEGTERALAWLNEHLFIVRYEHEGRPYIQVVNFAKHQSPHYKEPPSKIPKPRVLPSCKADEPGASGASDVSESQTSLGLEPDESASHEGKTALTPDSGLLTPDSGLLTADSGLPASRSVENGHDDDAEFESLKALYPRRSGDQRWYDARQAINARLREGHTWEQILDGVRRYAAWCRATGKIDTETVRQAATFVGKGKGFLEPWTLPATKADTRLAGNLSAAAEFMRRTEVG